MSIRRTSLHECVEHFIDLAGPEERRAIAQRFHEEIGRHLASNPSIGDDILVMLHRLSSDLRRAEFRPTPKAAAPRLTVRQRQILKMIAEGNSTREMAAMLHLSVKTIESHRAKLMDHLGIRDVAGLVVYAIRSGVIDLDRDARAYSSNKPPQSGNP
jgi:DNA-binding NarL/FixJ family response regulator